jgi:hypothetical protein
MMARKPATRVRAILELFRPIVDEIVLAADRSGDPWTLAECSDLADERFEIDPAPLNRRLGWLQEQCSSDWIFRFDDDETPSASLLASLRDLIQNRAPMQIGLPRRWLFKGPQAWIAQHPWAPDYQIRLVRNTPGAWRYPGLMHDPIQVLGELSLVDNLPIYHCELLLTGLEHRRAKRAEYEARRPGYRNGDFPVNWYYTPEDWGDVETAETPSEDLALIERVRAGATRRTDLEPLAPVLSAPSWEAERFNGSREVSAGAYEARVELVRPPAATGRGATRELEVVVTNLGDEFWTWGDYPPFIRLGYRWRSATGEPVSEGRCLFTETVRPGTTTRVVAPILAPSEPGRYRLEIDVLHEHVRWFDQGAQTEIEVR